MRIMPFACMRILVLMVFAFGARAQAQTTLNLSEDLVRLGIAATNMKPDQPTLDSGTLLVAGVHYAQTKKIPTVVADPGAYYFLKAQSNPCFANFAQLNDLTVDFQGSDLHFADLSAGGLCAYGANITLQNFTVDYLNLPFTQVVVTAADAEHARIQFTPMPGWQTPSSLNSILSAGGTPAHLILFRNGEPWPYFEQMPIQQPLADDHVVLLDTDASVVAQVREGDAGVIYAPKYSYSLLLGWFNVPCVKCALRNIRIYSGGKQPVFVVGESTVIERVYVMPKPGTDRLIGTTGVGIQLEVTGPGATIRLSRTIRPLDEGFATHVPVWGTVQTMLTNRSVQVQPWVAAGETLGARSVPDGTPLEFQSKSGGAILGTARLVSHGMASPVNGQPQFILNFDRDLPNTLPGSFVYSVDPAQRGQGTVVERNAFIAAFGRGGGIDTYGLMNSTVRGNYVGRAGSLGVFVNGSTFYDSETPPPQNITVTGNVIDGARSAGGGSATTLDTLTSRFTLGGIESTGIDSDMLPLTASPLRNVTISNNFIADTRRSGVWMGNATGGSVSGNYLFHPNTDPAPSPVFLTPADALSQPLVIKDSLGITTNDNTIDTTSRRMWVTDTQFNELAAYAPGAVYRLNAYKLGTVPNPAITLTDADGETSIVAIQKTSRHSIDIQLPGGARLGGAYLMLASGGRKYFGTLFIDSQDNIPAVNGCTYKLSHSSKVLAAGSAKLPILVVTQAGCSYQVLASDTFVSVVGRATGTAVLFPRFSANPGGTRITTIEIAGQPITVTQAGLTSSITSR